jgi:hypothetical protein
MDCLLCCHTQQRLRTGHQTKLPFPTYRYVICYTLERIMIEQAFAIVPRYAVNDPTRKRGGLWCTTGPWLSSLSTTSRTNLGEGSRLSLPGEARH